MTTLTVHEPESTPSAQAVAKGAKSVLVIDSRGRKITLKKPNVLAQYDLIEALEETAKNDVYVGMTIPLIYVTDIDGEIATVPTSKLLVRALIRRLGEEGVNAVMAGVQEHFGGENVEGDKAAIKK